MRRVEEFSRRLREGRDPAHDFSHIQRIARLCRAIAPPGVDTELVVLAAYFHGALEREDEVRRFLEELGVKEEYACRVLEAVRDAESGRPESPEGKVLYDANVLDALGAVGIARSFTKSGYESQSIEETMRIIRENVERTVYTPRAREMADDRRRFMKYFLERLEMELRYAENRRGRAVE